MCQFMLGLMFCWQSPHPVLSDMGCADESRIAELNRATSNLFKGTSRQLATEKWTPADPLNRIDELTFAKMALDKIPINQLCDDETFLRRTSLVLTGRTPDAELTRSFLDSTSPNKRAELIETFLQSDAFDIYWAFWFQEMFESTGRVLRNGRNLYNNYFDEAVAQSKPFDQMAFELLTTMGLTDEVAEPNFYARAGEMSRLQQDFWDNSAVMASEKFLGIRIECVSCHDGAYHLEDINLYLAEQTRQDLWGMAAFFAEIDRRPGTVDSNQILSLNIFKNARSNGYVAETDSGDRPVRSGGVIEPKYMFDGRGTDATIGRLESFATYVINDRQFARNYANRLWAHAFGIGMVEPIDSFDLYRIDANLDLPDGWDYQSFDMELLEHMSDAAVDFGYDLKTMLAYICNSATFQMDSAFPVEWQAGYTPYHTRYMARRMTSEMVFDSMIASTGVLIPIVQTDRSTPPLTLTYAHQLDDLDQPRARGESQSAVRVFLDTFGRGNRFDVPRTNDGGIAQALQLMNSDITMTRVHQNQGRLASYLAQGMAIATILDQLYLDTLCRLPNDDEKQSMLTELQAYGSVQEQAETALWLLLNKLEFIHIY